jgi:hypothetical protein
MLVVLGAVVIVASHALGRRVLTATRFVCVLVAVQLAVVLALCLAGNLLLDQLSIRYAMPALLPMMGLAVAVAVGPAARDDERPRWLGRVSGAWLVLLPVAGAIGLAGGIERTRAAVDLHWANRFSRTALAGELARRGLTHGFATYWNANLVTVLSDSRTRCCPVFIGPGGIVPQKSNIDASCFDRAVLPDRIYLVAERAEREIAAQAIAAALPPPAETFAVGDAFEVSVFELGRTELPWLDLPLAGGKQLRFPLRLPAKHAALRRAAAVATADGLAATGEEGTVVYGPYVRMPAGRYAVRWIGGRAGAASGEIRFDVTANGRDVLALRTIATGELPQGDRAELVALDFDLPRETPAVELRVFSHRGGTVVLHEVIVEERGARGP